MKENFKKKILKNGMTVMLEKRDLPIVSVILAAKMGSNYEEMSHKGISHFIEHMLYKGTSKRTAKDIAKDLEKNGGEVNGFTNEEMTGYWCKMPSSKLNIALDVLSDMVKNSLFDEKELEKERKVIFEEIKMRRDTPRIHVLDEIQKNLFSGVMAIDTIGTQETMNFIDRNEIIKVFGNSYTSDNLILCVVGDANFKDLVKFAEENFGEDKKNVSEKEVELKNEIRFEKRKGLDQANLVFAYHSPLANDDMKYAANILITLMAGGLSSRLFSEIREKRNLVYSILGGLEANKNYSYSYIYAGTMKENVEEVKRLILEEYEKVSKELTEEEFSAIKDQLIGQYSISMEESQIQMVNLLAREVHGNAEDFYNYPEKIKAVRLEDVKKLASKVKEGNYSFFALVPED
ncbi:MAG: insulinase family protein [Nanoarchaeota archaeon]|nr:insulinase family protein [Nanoarchaeota archaeon]